LAGEIPAQGGPPGPAVVRRGLPDVPQRVVITPDEDLQPAVRVLVDHRVAGDVAAQGGPPGPAVVRRGLPDVPDRVVITPGEHLEPAVAILGERPASQHTHGFLLTFAPEPNALVPAGNSAVVQADINSPTTEINPPPLLHLIQTALIGYATS